MRKGKNGICPVERAGHLDSRWRRRWLQNPRTILAPYVADGMTVLEIGCGPGFFTLDLARLVGERGRVIACDLQAGMLDRLRRKLDGTGLEKRVTFHQCAAERIAIAEQVDFILAFYMVHEVTDQAAFFREGYNLLNPDGRVLVVEPPLHVSKAAFEATVALACAARLEPVSRPRVFLGKTVLLQKG